MILVAANTVVSMRYIMRNAVGEELENTMNSLPVSYLHGTSAILSVLQDQLLGLQTGDKKTVFLQAGPGIADEDFTLDVIIDEVRSASEEEMVLGYPVQVNVPPCDSDCACYHNSAV